jgi:tRNA(Ile2) C34 agmatinyltransferase TiaS
MPDEKTDVVVDEEPVEPVECSICGGPALELGSLGCVKHYRCRNCGMQFSEKKSQFAM